MFIITRDGGQMVSHPHLLRQLYSTGNEKKKKH